MTRQDSIDFMSEPSPFDHDDYAEADGFYARRRYANCQLPANRSRARQLRGARDKSARPNTSEQGNPRAL